MTHTILTTKLYIQPQRPNLVRRQRLLDRLDAGLHRKLTLVSAPAGFGKTTLISAWIDLLRIAKPKVHVAWLSLDESDSDMTRFWTYVIAALQNVAPTIGPALLSMLESSQPTPMELFLTALLNEIPATGERFVLVLDDYHLIDSKPIDDAVAFLVDHLPHQIHVVITTREDPALPLARLRVRDQLTELRAKDLRFQSSETVEFLTHLMGLRLSAEDVETLEERTEGWVAGLQLAGLSLQNNDDVHAFIRAFSGDHRYIVDYLAEEVVDRQTESVRSFLLQTAILDRLTAPLCDAITQRKDTSLQLDALERGNFFIVPLDDNRQWYRYHHLFAQVLRTRLMSEQPALVTVLHQRASMWFEQHGLLADAIHHALTAEAFERAADLIERVAPELFRKRQEAVVLKWLQALPNTVFQNRPVLCIQYVGSLLTSGRLEGVEERLRDAEQWLDSGGALPVSLDPSQLKPTVVDEAEYQALPGSVAMYRAAQALVLGNPDETVRYGRRGLELAPQADYLRRGAIEAMLGLVFWASGDLEQARQAYANGMATLQKAGNISDVIGGSIALADIEIVLGRLQEAMQIYQHRLQLAVEQGTPLMRGTADMHVGMSELYCEKGDLEAAKRHLQISREQGEHTGFPQNAYRWRVAMARILQAEGKLDDALTLLEEAERLYVSDMYPNVRPVSAVKARVRIAQGHLDEAIHWARMCDLTAKDEISYLREFEHITLARLLLARSQHEHNEALLIDAERLLSRLLKAAEDGKRVGRVIEIQVLRALAHQLRGDLPAAIATLAQALTLAEPEGYVRVFVNEGEPMASLLQKALRHDIAPSYIRRLLSVSDKSDSRAKVHQALTEPLSDRELEVLRLFATELSGPEIARRLIVSLSTLRTHTQNVYTKLGVNSRRAAVRRAEELNLL